MGPIPPSGLMSGPSIGRLIDITGPRGCIDTGIPLTATVEKAVQTYMCRRHRVENLLKIEHEILSLPEKNLTHLQEHRLWKISNGEYKQVFSTKSTWELTRTHT